MLLIADYVVISFIENLDLDVKIYNISSLKEGYNKLNILPLNNISYKDEKDFDIQYANYLLNNDYAFCEFFNIIHDLYEGNHVCLLVTKNDDFDYITESLTKFISSRYGYSSNYVNEIEDLEYLDTESDFSLSGLYNLDIDKERFVLLKMGDGCIE